MGEEKKKHWNSKAYKIQKTETEKTNQRQIVRKRKEIVK